MSSSCELAESFPYSPHLKGMNQNETNLCFEPFVMFLINGYATQLQLSMPVSLRLAMFKGLQKKRADNLSQGHVNMPLLTG